VTEGPAVHQAVAWSGIEAEHLLFVWQQGDVRHTADVDDRSGFGSGEHRVMKRRCQWCALAAGRYVAAAKIRNSGDAREFGDGARVRDLERERVGALTGRLMADGLAMAADGGYVARLQGGVGHQLEHDRSGQLCQLATQAPEALDLVVSRLRKVVNGIAQMSERMGVGGDESGSPLILKVNQRCIQGIGAGSAHQADVERAGCPRHLMRSAFVGEWRQRRQLDLGGFGSEGGQLLNQRPSLAQEA